MLCRPARSVNVLHVVGCDLADFLHQLLHFADQLPLSFATTAAFGEYCGQVRYADQQTFHDLPGLLDLATPFNDLPARDLDQAANFFRRLGTPLSEAAHLAGHDGKAAALGARPPLLIRRLPLEIIVLQREAVDDACAFDISGRRLAARPQSGI